MKKSELLKSVAKDNNKSTLSSKIKSFCYDNLKSVGKITDAEIIENFEGEVSNIGNIYELDDCCVAIIDNSEVDYHFFCKDIQDAQKLLTDEIYKLNE